MARLGFRSFALLSLAVTAAAVFLWPRSYHTGYGVFLFGGRAGTVAAAAISGGTFFCYGNVDFGRERALTVRSFSDSADLLDSQREEVKAACSVGCGRRGFHAGYCPPSSLGLAGAWFVTLSVPLWFWLAAGVPLPAIVLVRWANVALRRRRGSCPECGYDLRASPGRCPECGWGPTPLPPDPAVLSA